jgi:hypothetical protein
MFQGGRGVDPEFLAAERLFLRFADVGYTEERSSENAILSAYIHFPESSVNREKYSAPTDVLFPSWTNWGVLAFPREAIPPTLTSSGQSRKDPTFELRFWVEHVPLAANYGHSELRASRNGSPLSSDEGGRVPKLVRKQFRELVASRATILRPFEPKEWFSWVKRRLVG